MGAVVASLRRQASSQDSLFVPFSRLKRQRHAVLTVSADVGPDVHAADVHAGAGANRRTNASFRQKSSSLNSSLRPGTLELIQQPWRDSRPGQCPTGGAGAKAGRSGGRGGIACVSNTVKAAGPYQFHRESLPAMKTAPAARRLTTPVAGHHSRLGWLPLAIFGGWRAPGWRCKRLHTQQLAAHVCHAAAAAAQPPPCLAATIHLNAGTKRRRATSAALMTARSPS